MEENPNATEKKRSYFWPIVLAIVVIIFGTRYALRSSGKAQQEANAEAARIAALRFGELRDAAVTAGTALATDPPAQDPDFGAVSARLLAINARRNQQFTDAELSKAWAQIVTDAGSGMVILQHIGRIDAEKPTGLDLLEKALQDDTPEQDKQFQDAAGARALAELDKASLQDKFRENASRLDGSIAALAQAADGLGQPPLGSVVAAQYLPSWDGTYWGDVVALQNTSSGSLDNAVEVITIHYPDGSAHTHVHYSETWPAGTLLKTIYPFRASDYMAAQATQPGQRPRSIDVAVYTGAGVARANVTPTDATWDDAIKSYCAKLKFTAQYLGPYTEDQTAQQYHAGIQFSFDGLPSLPVKSVTAIFTDAAGTAHSVRWDYPPGSSLQPNENQPLRSDMLDGDPPAHIEFTLSFADTGYEQKVPVY